MSTYKVIQDIEAEDKLIGPLSLRQFIFAGISALCLYLSFLCLTKHAGFLLVFFLPIAAFTGFFAFPWGKDQPTEVWALAKIRFALKPRKRIWDQSGVKDLVTITVPKKVVHNLTDGLNQDEVRSRLNALASTIDSRGWAVKNVNVNLGVPGMGVTDNSDRLVAASALPQQVSDVDVQASDDMLDAASNPIARQFDSMISASAATHKQQLLAQMRAPAQTNQPPLPAAQPVQTQPYQPAAVQTPQQQQPPANYWFMQEPPATPGTNTTVVTPGVAPAAASIPQAAVPTAEEEALVEKFKAENNNQTPAFGHMKTIKTSAEIQAEEAAKRAADAAAAAAAKPAVTPKKQAAIMNLAQNDDLDIATIARQAHKQVEENDGEVVISLH